MIIEARVQKQEINITKEMKALRSKSVGAIATFIGTVRDGNSILENLYLECYTDMAEKKIYEIAQEALKKWSLTSIIVVHRYGVLLPQEDIVFIGCSSPHRKSAISAMHYVIDFLKVKAPFWKKEKYVNAELSEKWIQQNDDDSIVLKNGGKY